MWNLADLWETVADAQPEVTAQVQGERRYSWARFDQRADAIAAALLAAGLRQHDKVAQYVYNGPEYMESVFGCFKAGLVPVNTNYRYTDDELLYVWENSDTAAVVFNAAFLPSVERLRSRLPAVRCWLFVADATSGPCPEWAVDYEHAAHVAPPRVRPPWGRSGDDIFLLYTGGTTGKPKGVMWRQDDIVMGLERSAKARLPATYDAEAVVRRLSGTLVAVPAAPLIHGTAWFNSVNVLDSGGTLVTLPSRSFDAIELLDAIQTERVKTIFIVGDAFSKPIVAALDTEPTRWDISSLRVVASSGVMWSSESKQGLLRHNPELMLVDALGSSEAIGMARSVSTATTETEAATFTVSESTLVINDHGRPVRPGSGERGRVALRGRAPVGYYKDPIKSAETFPLIDGVRYSVPGDWATVSADGTINLLGRGSVCINTGGEKVFPEEVEEVLKRHPLVADAVAVGVPDDRFGSAVWAVVEPDGGPIDEADLIAHVKRTLAGFKAPKRILTVPSIDRGVNGKVDYRRWSAYAAQQHTSDA